MSYFKSLSLFDWRQFDKLEIDLSNRITVITGSNGCGKTTILSLLSRHFGWTISFASSPYLSRRAVKRLYRDVREESETEFHRAQNNEILVGKIIYDEGQECKITTPEYVGAHYNVNLQNQVQKPGLFIPSHRQQSVYNAVQTIPANPVDSAQMYEQYRGIAAQLYQTGGVNVRKNPGAVQKEAIIALALFGEGNQASEPIPEYHELFQSFEERLRIILPPEIGFQRLKVRMPDVVLKTGSGEFSLDSMSGGVAALFNIAWQIHMFDVSAERYTIVIDEPENHLHPSMQRSILPSLAEAFPLARFVVATHSPFIVSSFREASVHVLNHNSVGKVVSNELTEANVAGSANSILQDVLGVESTLPEWVHKIISNQLVENSDESPEVQAENIMSKLREFGITNVIGEFKK